MSFFKMLFCSSKMLVSTFATMQCRFCNVNNGSGWGRRGREFRLQCVQKLFSLALKLDLDVSDIHRPCQPCTVYMDLTLDAAEDWRHRPYYPIIKGLKYSINGPEPNRPTVLQSLRCLGMSGEWGWQTWQYNSMVSRWLLLHCWTSLKP